MSQTEVQLIKDAVIVNADISNSAAIDVSKISGALPAAGGTITGDVTFDGETAGRDIVFDRSDNALEFADNAKAMFGAGDDLRIYHSGTHSFIQDTGSGNLEISSSKVAINNAANNANMATFTDGGSVELYHNTSKKFETSSTGITITGDANWNDNGKAEFGNAADLQIYHDGSHSYIQDVGTGDLKITSNGGQVVFQKGTTETLAAFATDSGCELYHDNTKKLETTANGIEVFNRVGIFGGTAPSIQFNPDATGADTSTRVMFGQATGNNNFVNGSSANDVVLNCPREFIICHGTSELMAVFNNDGKVELYHDNTKKFETTSDGVSVLGTLTTDKATFTDDGSGEPIVHIRTDDANPWAFVINNDNSSNDTTSGLKWYVQNDGDGIHQIRGSSAFKNYFMTTSNSTTSENALAINTNRGVDLYYQNSKKLETVSGGVNIIGALTVNGGSVGGGKVLQVLQTTSNLSSTGSGSFQDVGLSQAITMTNSANKVLVIASGGMNNAGAGNGGGATIFRGSTNLAHSNDIMAGYFGEDNSNNIEYNATFHKLDTPGAGTHTYAVKQRAFSGTQRFAYRNTGVLTVIELDFS